MVALYRIPIQISNKELGVGGGYIPGGNILELWILGTLFQKSTESWTIEDFSASVNDHALHVQHALNSFLRATAQNEGRKSQDFG